MVEHEYCKDVQHQLVQLGYNWGVTLGKEECNVMKSWDETCKNESDTVKVCEQLREMCSWRIRYDITLVIEECRKNTYIYSADKSLQTHCWP